MIVPFSWLAIVWSAWFVVQSTIGYIKIHDTLFIEAAKRRHTLIYVFAMMPAIFAIILSLLNVWG